MPKISVIVPVYNTEKYLDKCINSILEQKNVDYEIIVVNDGSTDNSSEVMKKYLLDYGDRIKYYEKTNGGLSDARNYGVDKATGDFLCFVDSDDYIDSSLFSNLEKYILQDVDLIKYKCIRVNSNHEIIEKVEGPVFETVSGEDAFNMLYSSDVLLEPAWLYLYRREFYLNNKFAFPVGKYHEDWATTPYIIISAKTVVSADVYGYYYVQSSNSITRDNNDEKALKRAQDMLEHYDNFILKLDNSNVNNNVKENFKIYLSNCLILKVNDLPLKYHKEYISQLKKRKIASNLKARNIKQFIKKIVLKISIKLYLKLR